MDEEIGMALDEERLHPMPGQEQRGRQPGQATAGDEDGEGVTGAARRRCQRVLGSHTASFEMSTLADLITCDDPRDLRVSPAGC
jgi:hypothetical protein